MTNNSGSKTPPCGMLESTLHKSEKQSPILKIVILVTGAIDFSNRVFGFKKLLR